jgi:curved DNA-binding protein CbpA
MKNRRNYYRILQVQPDAPVEIIRASYRTLMLELKRHPDLGGSNLDAAVLNEAYEVLANPARRAAYDKGLLVQYTRRADGPDRSPSPTFLCPVCRRPLAQKPLPGERCSTCLSPLQSEKPTKHGRDYRRASTRTRRDDKISYQSSWPGQARQGKMIDFSPQGMRFHCQERLLPGSVLKISSDFLVASGTVTNLREEILDGRRVYSVGISFIAVSFLESGVLFSTSA